MTAAAMILIARTVHAQAPSQRAIDISRALTSRDSAGDVTVAGRATVPSGKLQASAFDIAIQDGTGGIRVYSRAPQPAVQAGDSIVATGHIKTYRGNAELVATNVRIIAGVRRAINPMDVAIDTAVVARHLGELVRVHGHVAAAGHSEGGQWLRLVDTSSPAGGTLTIWVPANHGAAFDLSGARSSDSVVATGIVTAYRDNAEDPVIWQIVPRDSADVVVGTAKRGIRGLILWSLLGALILIGAGLAIARIHTRRHLHALRETDVRYHQLLALLPDAVIVHADGRIVFTNPAAAELLGLPSERELIGQPLSMFIHADSIETFARRSGRDAPAPSTRVPSVRARMVSAGGGVVDVEVTSSACVYHDRPAMLLLARDITAQLRYERDLHTLALVDELTGLQNRRAFTLFAEQELARARRSGSTPVMVFADLDGLKQINDTHGHAAGDMALKLVASALRSIFRETDIVARWSGDEFVALMVDGSEEAAQIIATRLDAAVAAQTPAQLPFAVTASVGASKLDPALPLRDAMERADAELYSEKKRNRHSKIRQTPVSIDAVNVDG